MIHGDMKYYSNGRKKKYNAWSKTKKKSDDNDKGDFVFQSPTVFRRGVVSDVHSLDTKIHDCSKPAKQEYTGTLIKGISTMHKSNAVPIINEQEAKEHANMRR